MMLISLLLGRLGGEWDRNGEGETNEQPVLNDVEPSCGVEN